MDAVSTGLGSGEVVVLFHPELKGSKTWETDKGIVVDGTE
jgi:hypothetical protein